MNSNQPTVLEDYTALIKELPYWCREVYGRQVIDRVEDFIVDNGGDKYIKKPTLKNLDAH
jgi:hypothetical protein